MMGYAYMEAGFVFMKLFELIFLLGVILFIVWAIRTLKKNELGKWMIGLLLVGVLGMAGSVLLAGRIGGWYGGGEKYEGCGQDIWDNHEMDFDSFMMGSMMGSDYKHECSLKTCGSAMWGTGVMSF